jgi:hypothetical protein
MPCHAVPCRAVQCSAVQCSAVQCSAVQCSAVQCSAVQCSAVQCSAVQCSAVQCSAVQCAQRRALGIHTFSVTGPTVCTAFPQAALPQCCQHATGGDYWCATPSTHAMASVIGQVLYTYGRDAPVVEIGGKTYVDRTFTHPLLYERILQMHARVRSVCSEVGATLPGVLPTADTVCLFR